jgi:uncharacterized protein (TIGR03000 family)
MYSAIMVAALMTTSTTPQWGHRCGGWHCGHSCTSGYSGYSGYAGYAAYAGYAGYSCHGCGGCSAQVHVPSYGWAGGCYGYHGGCYGAGYSSFYVDPHYSGCTGCYGCYGGYAGYGMPVPVIVDPRVPPKDDPLPPINPGGKDPKGGEEVPLPKEKTKKASEDVGRATISIDIPEGGKLFVDGNAIKATAGKRTFQTPPLAIGERYFYDIRIEIAVNGTIRSDEKRVIIERGQSVAVDFTNIRRDAILTAERGR